MELEAQLELKITANAGSRLKLEKVCMFVYAIWGSFSMAICGRSWI